MAKKKIVEQPEVTPVVIGKDAIELINSSIVCEDNIIVYEIGDQTVSVIVHPRVTLVEWATMAEEIADFCFVDDYYVPYMRDIGRISTVLAHYTNIDVDSVGTENIRLLWNNGKFMADLYDCISDDLSTLYADAERLVEWRKQNMLKSQKADELYDTVIKFFVGLESVLDRVADTTAEDTDLNKLVDAVNKLSNLDEKQLAHAVLDFKEAQKKVTPTKRATKKKASTPSETTKG